MALHPSYEKHRTEMRYGATALLQFWYAASGTEQRYGATHTLCDAQYWARIWCYGSATCTELGY
eukprot:979943-Rhodomonas_salina.1